MPAEDEMPTNSSDPYTSELGGDRSREQPLRVGARHYRAYVGPPGRYDIIGASQFRLLCALGLREHNRLLDIGCGSLRAGRLFIPYLVPDRYYGIEPNQWLVEEGIRHELGQDIIALKRPRFDDTADFDFSHLGIKFDYILAQSIFSHTGPELIRRALANVSAVMHQETRFLATFVHSSKQRPANYKDGWRYPGCMIYDPATIREFIGEAGLFGQHLPWYHPTQHWYLITNNPKGLLSTADAATMHGRVFFNEGSTV